MKKELLLSIFIILCGTLFSLGKSEDHYIPMVVDGNEWHGLHYGGYWENPFYSTKILKIAGDTVVSGINYKKVLYTKERSAINWGLEGVIREDILQKKVYFRKLDRSYGLLPEFLLYDFSMEVGDVMTLIDYNIVLDNIYSSEYVIKVKDIEYVTIDGIERKQYLVDFDFEAYERKIIEGIGAISNALLISPQLCGSADEFLCFSQNGNLVYKNPIHEDKECFYDEEDYSFPGSDAMWVINNYSGDDNNKQYIYGLSGDTIIDNIVYHKLYLLNDTTLNIESKDIYVGGIRLGSSKRVWMKPADKKNGASFKEYLLYDFLETRQIDFQNVPFVEYGNNPTFENVESVRDYNVNISEVLYTLDQRITVLNSYPYDTWIQFVGSISGLFFPAMRYPLCGGNPAGTELQCMKHRGRIKYLKDGCDSCFQEFNYSSVETNKSNTANVYYNAEIACVVVNSESPCRLYLYDLNGQVRKTADITTVNSDVDVSSLSKGVYIYKLGGDNLNQRGKLIIL